MHRKNPFSRPSWLQQEYRLTSHRAKQLRLLFGKTVKDISVLKDNGGRFPAFVGIRWGYAEIQDDILLPSGWRRRLVRVVCVASPAQQQEVLVCDT